MTTAAPASREGAGASGPTARPRWLWARRIGTWAFFALVAWLLVKQARGIDWDDVMAAFSRLPASTLLTAAALAAASFTLYSTYDLLGRYLTGHPLGTRTVMGVTFISYAFNLNLGSLVGGVAFRYRLYSRLGLGNAVITRVLGFSMLTNWFGYLVVAGAAFCFWPLDLPPDWKIDSGGLRVLGGVLLALGAGYLVLCATAKEKTLSLRGHELQVPTLRMALLQLVMSCTNWSLMGGVVWLLLQQKVAYPEVLAVLLVGAVAGVITHVPAGLGVLEAVFVALLSHKLPQGQILAGLIGYRALYYLAPLAIATIAYVAMEVRARRASRASGQIAAPKPPKRY
ncbi:lysylphosphatidylglycerol synthase domain-containing protein [Variovorax sp. J22G21]|uniref:lysylphosphatidylglycerol synthase domain-containing protein n=1 Tax=Variovorax fucosicus TaxID=3053517 RepID=UPI0025749B2F|nr:MULTISPECIES: lysylphosphatidylglycerol synthase domain-containing protein [unclassified Variovorax]MDM0039286.1 lysylphosphatidylglycerol synthase domain-containing protein [Variovorax sp. J22R193]MDM0055110.1 lysylphosphatidylglycerol synthase domain-containing protein [Variovorax sp. J22G47]MDM0064062.1 lysylphosphatidylglycerol synthase domain-containing protein [Variovorax sp. J22G21]